MRNLLYYHSIPVSAWFWQVEELSSITTDSWGVVNWFMNKFASCHFDSFSSMNIFETSPKKSLSSVQQEYCLQWWKVENRCVQVTLSRLSRGGCARILCITMWKIKEKKRNMVRLWTESPYCMSFVIKQGHRVERTEFSNDGIQHGKLLQFPGSSTLRYWLGPIAV